MVAARPRLVRDRRFRVEACRPEAVADEVRADRHALKVPDQVPEDDGVRVDDRRVQQAGVAVGVQLALKLLSVRSRTREMVLQVA